MSRLKKVLVDPPTNWWEVEPDPETKDWTFNYYCESYMQRGESLEDAIQRQQYRVVATHKVDSRTRTAVSKKSFNAAYHNVLTMLMAEK